MNNVLKYLLDTYASDPFKENQIRIEEVVFNLALPPGRDLEGGCPGI
jgi:hypothetical protein